LEPNAIELQTFEYTTGASNVKLGVRNANLTTLTFRSGAGSYRLEFNGALPAYGGADRVHISSVEIVILRACRLSVNFEGGLSDVNTFGAWDANGSLYSQTGDGYTIRIKVKMGAGNLELRNK
jgi:hypothetical protein